MFNARKWILITGLMFLIPLAACNTGDSMSDEATGKMTDESSPRQETGEPTVEGRSTQGARASGDDDGDDTSGTPDAMAELAATSGHQASGAVKFYTTERGIRVDAMVNGLSPGQHGFHVHARGDCSSPDASSAGGHYNPEDVRHGAPGDPMHHVGDLGNIEADDSGQAMLNQEFEFLSLSGDNSIVGKAVVVHAGEDDLESQPSGAAGARVACGVIQAEDA